MQIVARERFPVEQDFRDAWNALVQTMEGPQVFCTWEWAQAIVHAYATSVKPLLLTAYREEQLVGVVALTYEESRNRASFLAGSTADYCDFVSGPEDREQFVVLAMQELRRLGVREVFLANLPADSLSAQALRSNRRQIGFSTFMRPAYLCAQVPVDSDERRNQTRRSARAKLRRMRNAAGDADFVVQHATDWREIESELSEFTRAHVQRFLTAGRISNLIRAERRAFLVELARLLSPQEWFTFSTLQRGGRTIAWNYGFRFAGNWFWYQPAFDIEASHLSPGSYLLCEILEQACKDPRIQNVDLGLGDEEYKQRYSKSGRLTLNITASSPSGRAFAVCRYRSAELVKRFPRLEHRVRAWAAGAAKVRRAVAKNGSVSAIWYYVSRMRTSLTSAGEVSFFECSKPRLSNTAFSLQALTSRLLARAVIEDEKDPQTLEYALRAAQRLASSTAQAYALVTAGTPLHFCWISPFEGFYLSEFRQVLKEPVANSVLLFDCWTPPSKRGNGYYGLCIAEVANLMLAQGKRPWIFSAVSNISSLRGIEKSGFVPRFSLLQRKRFLVNRISSVPLNEVPSPQLDLYPAA